MNNLRKAGFMDFTDEDVLLKEETSDKTNRREAIEEKYEIILYLGDNLRDFSEIYGGRGDDFGKKVVNENFERLENKFVLFPNPVYGEWEKPILNGVKASEERAVEKLKVLQP